VKAERGKNYQLRARKEAYETRVMDVGLLGEETKRIDFFLAPAKGGPGFEFTDPPEFTVAGVTDWSNVGLHGSDVNVKTSEALTKETAGLKPSDTGNGGSTTGAGAAHRLVGDEKEKSGDPAGAEREYAEAVKLEPSEENYFVWGRELLLHRAGKAAAEVLSKGAQLYPASERMKEALGAAYYANGQYLEAAQEVCSCVGFETACPRAIFDFGEDGTGSERNIAVQRRETEAICDRATQGSAGQFFLWASDLEESKKNAKRSGTCQCGRVCETGGFDGTATRGDLRSTGDGV